MGVSTTFEYEPAEHYRALRAITNLTPLRWLTVVCGLLLPAVVVAYAAWSVRARGADPIATALGWLPILAALAFWAALIPITQRRQARRLPAVDASVTGPQERTVDAAGYHSRGNGVALDVPWHALQKAVETDQFFIFFYNWQCGYYLPKRYLSPADTAEVRRFAKAGLGERARVRG